MKKKFTFLMAALMLLMMIGLPGMVKGQTRTTNTLFEESFTESTGTMGWSGSAANGTIKYDNTGWSCDNAYGAGGSAKFGTGSKLGKATTPSISLENDATLTFKAGAWNGGSENTTLKIGASGCTLKQNNTAITTVTMTKGSWTTYTVDITNVTGTSITITFEGNATSNSRFLLDDVKVTQEVAPANPTITFTGTTTFDIENTGTTYQAFAGTYSDLGANPSFSVAFYSTAEATTQLTGDDIPSWITVNAYDNNGALGGNFSVMASDVYTQRHAYFKVYSGTTYSTNVITVNQAAAPEPDYSVTLSGTSVNATYAGGTDNSITVSTDLTGEEVEYEVLYNQGNSTYAATPNPYDWFSAAVTNGKLVCTIQPNSSGSERSAQLKVYAIDDNYNEAYSDVVTVTQTPIAAPTFYPNGGEYHGTVSLTMTTETTGASIYYTIGDDVPDNTSTLYDPEDKPTISAGTYNAIACAMVSSTPVYSDITTVTFTQAQVAAPTFSPAGEVLSGTTVTISCATDGAAIQYSTDNGSNWTSGNTVTITTATTLKAKATKEGYADSEVATADYTIATPMTVAEAIAYIDGSGSSEVDKYVSGVIESVVSYNETYQSITYWISDDGTETNRLEVFGGLSGIDGLNFTSTDDLKVGDEVIVKGKLKKYNSTYEFDSNNHLVYLHREASIHCSDIALAWNQTSDQKTAVINVSGGELTASTEDTWYSVAVSGTTISVTITPNTTDSQRNGTITLTYTYDTKATITKDITVTQAAKPAMCTVSFSVNGTVSMTTDVPQGEELNLSNFEAPVESETYSFAGWTESDPNTRITTFTPANEQTAQTLYAVYGVGSYELITNANNLVSGSKVIIANTAKDYAISTTQNNTNRTATGISCTNNVLSNISESVCQFTLGTRTVSNNTYWTFNDGNGYIYAASSSANQLKTKNTIDDNCAFSVTIGNDGTTIEAKGTYSRKVIRYNPNNNSPIFSCYATNSTTGTLCSIFQKNITSYTKSIGDLEPTASMSNIPENAVIVVNDGTVFTLTGDNNGYATSLIIEDGGQLIASSSVAATFKMTMTDPSSKDIYGWSLITSPVHDGTGSTLATEHVTNLTPVAGNYDMFAYDEVSHYWFNQKPGNDHSFSTLNKGQGYMYRNAGNELSFVGNTNSGTFTRDLTYSSTTAGDLAGFHLVGNPYTHDITLEDNVVLQDGDGDLNDELQLAGYYLLKNGGSEWTSALATDAAISNKQGFLIQIPEEATKIKFTEGGDAKRGSRSNGDNIKFMVSNSQYDDVAYALFDEAYGLAKIDHRNADVPMLYINQNGKDYAIATMSDDTKAFNLNFKAATMGQYTLSYKADGKFEYLHVIDLLTGEDIDMLLEGEYSFMGSPRDNENRFLVKLSYKAGDNESNDDIFAYQSGNEVIVNGTGELQIFDVTGRKVMTTTINGAESITVPAQGVYIFRLVGNEVKTQKIVVR